MQEYNNSYEQFEEEAEAITAFVIFKNLEDRERTLELFKASKWAKFKSCF